MLKGEHYYGLVNRHNFMLNGDAGIKALTCASNFAEGEGIELKECKFIQVPHHGSRNNVSPSILNRIIGNIVLQGTDPTKTAFVSASEKDSNQPRNSVINAFTRRGVKVFKTEGNRIWHHSEMPDREDYHTIVPIGFFEEKPIGSVLYVLSFIINCIFAYSEFISQSKMIPPEYAIITGFLLVCIAVGIFAVTTDFVYHAGEKYVKSLLTTCEEI